MGMVNLPIFPCPYKTLCHLYTYGSAKPSGVLSSPNSQSNFSQLALSSDLPAASESLLMHSSTEGFVCAKLKYCAWKTLLSSVRWGAKCRQRKAACWKFLFSSVSVKQRTLHHFSFLTAASVRPALTVVSLDHHLVLHARCNCRPFVFVVVWCIARQVDRNGETLKHFHNCIKVLSQFRTPHCTNLRQYSNSPKRGGAHDNAQIPNLQFSLLTSAPENCVGS